MRGFDIFMRAAKRIYTEFPDVQFIVVGTERIAYGGDEGYINGKSFKEWVLKQDSYDLNKIRFVGRVEPTELSRLLAATDLHVYLTVPFVLSWSMMDAMSCGAVVLASNTSPVREMITDGENGLLADFFSPEEFAEKALKVLRDPDSFRPLGRAAEQFVEQNYSLDAVLPQMLKLYDDAIAMPAGPDHPRPKRQELPIQQLSPSARQMPPQGVRQPAPGQLRSRPTNPKPGGGRKSPFRG
jgi:glycosyltransferase involved in cell wall biosynthesis